MPNGASGLAGSGLEYAISGNGSIPGMLLRTQAVITEQLKQQMQMSAGWLEAHIAAFAGLPAGVPLVPGILMRIASAITGLPIEHFIEIWNDTSNSAAAIVSTLDALKNTVLEFLTTNSPLDAAKIFGQLNSLSIGLIPLSAIADFQAEQLVNPGFDTAGSLTDDTDWTWDPAVGYTRLGSATAVCDGTLRVLESNRVEVNSGQQIAMSGKWFYEGVTSEADSEPFRIMAAAYDRAGHLLEEVNVATLTEPTGDSNGAEGATENGWFNLAGVYTVPNNAVDYVSLILVCDVEATAGNVWVDDCSITRQGNPSWLQLVKDTTQDLIDAIVSAINGVISIGNNIPGLKGAVQTLQAAVSGAGTLAGNALEAAEDAAEDLAEIMAGVGAAGVEQFINILNQIKNGLSQLIIAVTGAPGTITSFATWIWSAVFGQINPQRLGLVPVSSVAVTSPNLLNNGGFDDEISVDDNPDWEWDGTDGFASDGCAKGIANGSPKILVSNLIPVSVDDDINVSVHYKYEDLTGEGVCIKVAIDEYDASNNRLSSHTLHTISDLDDDDQGWTEIATSYTVPVGVERITLALELYAVSGTVKFDDASVVKVQLMPQNFVSGLPQSLSDLAANIQLLINKIWESITGLAAVGSKSLTDLGNALIAIPMTSITGLGGALLALTNNLSSIVANVNAAFSGLASAGNPITDAIHTNVTNFLNQVQQGLTGAVNTAIVATTTTLAAAQEAARQAAVAAQNQILGLFGLIPRTTTAIGAVYTDNVSTVTTVSSNDWGDGWTLIYGTGSTHKDGDKIVWDDSGSSDRAVIQLWTDPTDGAYQTVRATFGSQPEQPLAGGTACYDLLIANSTIDGSEFMWAKFIWNRLEVGYYDGGVGGWGNPANYHFLSGFTTSNPAGFPVGSWAFKAGTEADPYQYIISFGQGDGANQVSFTDSDMNIPADSDHVYGGLGLFSKARGSGEGTPASVSMWVLEDTDPTEMIGSGFLAYRTNTAAVSMCSSFAGENVPGSFFDNVEYCSADYTWNGATSELTVKNPGMYMVTVHIAFQQRYYNRLTQAIIFRNGSFYKAGNSVESIQNVNTGTAVSQIALRGVFFSFPVRCITPNTVLAPGVWSQSLAGTPAPAQVNAGGEPTGTVSWFAVAKMNP